MLNYFWIMFGGALGTGARFWASGLVAYFWSGRGPNSGRRGRE